MNITDIQVFIIPFFGHKRKQSFFSFFIVKQTLKNGDVVKPHANSETP